MLLIGICIAIVNPDNLIHVLHLKLIDSEVEADLSFSHVYTIIKYYRRRYTTRSNQLTDPNMSILARYFCGKYSVSSVNLKKQMQKGAQA